MKHYLQLIVLISVFLALPAMAAGKETQNTMPTDMQHGSMPMNMQHGSMPTKNTEQGTTLMNMPMGAMKMDEKMEQIGETTEDGILAQAHITDVSTDMAKNNQPFTHHLMVMFTGMDKKGVIKGRCAVKVTGPDGKTGDAVTMMSDATHFGADLTLPVPGAYTFTVGTKFEDNKTRQFVFNYTKK